MAKIESDIVIADKARMANKLNEYAGSPRSTTAEPDVTQCNGMKHRMHGKSYPLVMELLLLFFFQFKPKKDENQKANKQKT